MKGSIKAFFLFSKLVNSQIFHARNFRGLAFSKISRKQFSQNPYTYVSAYSMHQYGIPKFLIRTLARTACINTVFQNFAELNFLPTREKREIMRLDNLALQGI